MHAAAKGKLYTVSEYLALEERATHKHEYYNGKIVRTPGADFIHNQIAANITAALIYALYNTIFIVLNSDMKIHIPRLESVVYPDAVVVLEKPLFFEGRTDNRGTDKSLFDCRSSFPINKKI